MAQQQVPSGELINLSVTFELTPTFAEASRIFRRITKQVPFAAKQALNEIALLFQFAQRRQQESAVTIRQTGYFQRAVKITRDSFATIDNLTSQVVIDSRPSAVRVKSARPDIWLRQEEGETRKSKGNSGIAVPAQKGDLKFTGKGLIRKRDYPDQVAKRKRDFTVPFPSGDFGVFERIGRKRPQGRIPRGSRRKAVGRVEDLRKDENVRYLYHVNKTTRTEQSFTFFETAQKIWLARWQPVFNQEIKKAFATIKF